MATENEEILKAHIEDLQSSMIQMTGYLNELVQTVNQNQNMADNYSHQFYSQDQVDVYLPFYASPTAMVSVMVEEAPGQYRQITPMITINGQTVTVNFDRQQSGYVIVDNDVGCAMDIKVPPNFVSMGSVSLYEPALEPPFVEPIDVPTPTEVQSMAVKTPPGSENISSVEIEKLMTEQEQQLKEKQFAKAMGVASTWP